MSMAIVWIKENYRTLTIEHKKLWKLVFGNRILQYCFMALMDLRSDGKLFFTVRLRIIFKGQHLQRMLQTVDPAAENYPLHN